MPILWEFFVVLQQHYQQFILNKIQVQLDRVFTKINKLEINRFIELLVKFQLQLQMHIDIELEDNIINLHKIQDMFKISFICLIDLMKKIINLILNLLKLYKSYLFFILNINLTVQQLLLGIFLLQELIYILLLLELLVHYMVQNMEELIKQY